MVEIPTVIVYIGTGALVVVCGFMAVLLYYLIQLTKIVVLLARVLERWQGQIEKNASKVRRIFRLTGALFGRED